MATSDIESVPPGRRTRKASRKKRARDGKWNAASTLIAPSNEPSANGSRHASAHTARPPASRRLPRPAASWLHVMFTAVSERGLRDRGDHGILRAEAVADVQDVAADRQRAREPFDEAPHGDGGFLRIAAVALPQPEVQPPRRERQEEVRADRVVDGRGRVPAVAQHRERVPHVLDRPAARH